MRVHPEHVYHSSCFHESLCYPTIELFGVSLCLVYVRSLQEASHRLMAGLGPSNVYLTVGPMPSKNVKYRWEKEWVQKFSAQRQWPLAYEVEREI